MRINIRTEERKCRTQRNEEVIDDFEFERAQNGSPESDRPGST